MTGSKLSFERLTDRSLRGWSIIVRRFAWLIVASGIVATGLALIYTVKEIRIDTSTSDLVAQDLPFLEQARAYKKAFKVCLPLIPSAAEILGFLTIFSQCEQSVRVRQTIAKSLGR